MNNISILYNLSPDRIEAFVLGVEALANENGLVKDLKKLTIWTDKKLRDLGRTRLFKETESYENKNDVRNALKRLSTLVVNLDRLGIISRDGGICLTSKGFQLLNYVKEQRSEEEVILIMKSLQEAFPPLFAGFINSTYNEYSTKRKILDKCVEFYDICTSFYAKNQDKMKYFVFQGRYKRIDLQDIGYLSSYLTHRKVRIINELGSGPRAEFTISKKEPIEKVWRQRIGNVIVDVLSELLPEGRGRARLSEVEHMILAELGIPQERQLEFLLPIEQEELISLEKGPIGAKIEFIRLRK